MTTDGVMVLASLSSIRDNLKSTIENISGLRVYDTVPDIVNPPGVVISPDRIEFATAMQRGFDEYNFDVLVLVSRASSRSGQDELDSYITGAGSTSIRQILFNNSDLGLSDTDAFVESMTGYNASYEVNGRSLIGANLSVKVITKGTA